MNRQILESFTEGKSLSITPYGRTVAIAALPAAGAFSRGWNLVWSSDIEYTLVYHFESTLMAGDVEEFWRRGEIPASVGKTFGEIDGMWSNKKNRLRIFCRFTAQTQGDFNEALIRSFEMLSGAVLGIWELYAQEVGYMRIPNKDRYSEEKRAKFMEMVKGPDFMEDLPMFDEDGEALELSFLPPVAEQRRGFAEVAGMNELKCKLADEVIWPLKNRANAAKYRITPPYGMLLYGPPGCGKTFFAEKLAEEAGFSFKMVVPSEIGGMIIHETQKKVAELFEEARRMAPCIICFDEIDAMVPRRTSTPGAEYQNTEVNEFLVQMNNCGDKGIFIIGTTNNRDLIDPAALRTGRLDYQVEIPFPDKLQREQLFRVCLYDRPVEADIDLGMMAETSGGLTASDIAFVVNRAALAAARKDTPISESLLMSSIRSCDRCVSGQAVQSVDEPDKMGDFQTFRDPREKKILS